MNISLQLFGIRDFMAQDPKGTLLKVKEMGYDGVETCGMYEMTPEEYKEYCDSIGLKIMSAHGGIDWIINDSDQTFSDYKKLGCDFLVIAYLLEEYLPGNEKHDKVMNELKIAMKKAKEYGLRICYHNHEYEFSEYEDGTIISYIFEDAGPDLNFEPDVCWISAAGLNPSEYIKTFGAKCPIIHLKDFQYDGEIIKTTGRIKRPDGWKLVPVGYGDLDVETLFKSAISMGAEWFVVEQDNPSDGMTQLEAAEKSIKWLRSKGY